MSFLEEIGAVNMDTREYVRNVEKRIVGLVSKKKKLMLKSFSPLAGSPNTRLQYIMAFSLPGETLLCHKEDYTQLLIFRLKRNYVESVLTTEQWTNSFFLTQIKEECWEFDNPL